MNFNYTYKKKIKMKINQREIIRQAANSFIKNNLFKKQIIFLTLSKK